MIDWSHLGLNDFEKQRVRMSIKGKDNRHTNVARLSALSTRRLYLQETFLVIIAARG